MAVHCRKAQRILRKFRRKEDKSLKDLSNKPKIERKGNIHASPNLKA